MISLEGSVKPRVRLFMDWETEAGCLMKAIYLPAVSVI